MKLSYSQIDLFVDEPYSVSSYLDSINDILKPFRATVKGEISSITVRERAVYISLRDKNQNASLDCLLWRNKYNMLGVKLEEGMEVTVTGVSSIYKPNGRFSFLIDRIGLIGEGALKQAFEALQRRLESLGYFAQERKMPLPAYPKIIGLITSAYGDARNDFLTHLATAGFTVHFYDTRVEGVHAIESIVEAIRWFNTNMPSVDVLVITRGGGSMESLQAFNSEDVAKELFASSIPIISAVGHENDITIADMVADVRASTPTDAGKMISQSWILARNRVEEYSHRITSAMKMHIQTEKARIEEWKQRMLYTIQQEIARKKDIKRRYSMLLNHNSTHILEHIYFKQETFKRNLVVFQREFQRARARYIQVRWEVGERSASMVNDIKRRLNHNTELLSASDPKHKLKQGYSIIHKNNTIIRSTNDVKPGDAIQLSVTDGTIHSQVTHNTYDQ